jgi:hypothetical protein
MRPPHTSRRRRTRSRAPTRVRPRCTAAFGRRRRSAAWREDRVGGGRSRRRRDSRPGSRCRPGPRHRPRPPRPDPRRRRRARHPRRTTARSAHTPARRPAHTPCARTARPPRNPPPSRIRARGTPPSPLRRTRPRCSLHPLGNRTRRSRRNRSPSRGSPCRCRRPRTSRPPRRRPAWAARSRRSTDTRGGTTLVDTPRPPRTPRSARTPATRSTHRRPAVGPRPPARRSRTRPPNTPRRRPTTAHTAAPTRHVARCSFPSSAPPPVHDAHTSAIPPYVRATILPALAALQICGSRSGERSVELPYRWEEPRSMGNRREHARIVHDWHTACQTLQYSARNATDRPSAGATPTRPLPLDRRRSISPRVCTIGASRSANPRAVLVAIERSEAPARRATPEYRRHFGVAEINSDDPEFSG